MTFADMQQLNGYRETGVGAPHIPQIRDLSYLKPVYMIPSSFQPGL
jgi:hypothetical protein